MKKMIAIVLAVVAALAIVGVIVHKDNDNEKFKKVDIGTGVTVTTENPTGSMTKSECGSFGQKLTENWASLADVLQEAEDSGVSNNSEVIAAAVKAVKSGITATNTWLASCSSYYPEQAAVYTALVSRMQSILDTL